MWNKEKGDLNDLLRCYVRDGKLHVELAKPAGSIRFIGQDGKLAAELEDTASAAYELQDEDTYIRTEIDHDVSTMYLNPVYRYESGDPLLHWNQVQAKRRAIPTLVSRVAGGLLFLAALYFIIFRKKRPRQAAPTASSGT